MKSCLWVTLVVLLAEQQHKLTRVCSASPSPTKHQAGSKTPWNTNLLLQFSIPNSLCIITDPTSPSSPCSDPLQENARMFELLSQGRCPLLEYPKQLQSTAQPCPSIPRHPGTQLLMIAAVLPQD